REIISHRRRQIRILTSIITGHYALNKHLYTLSLRCCCLRWDTCRRDICRGCLDDEETPLHFPCYC
ncbi:hypothetical protein EAI_06341, partial [Harpegnathos saltator]